MEFFFYDFLGRCAFGIDTDVQNNPENIYFKKVEETFRTMTFRDLFVFKVAQVVPVFNAVLAWLFAFQITARAFINARLLPLISSTIQLEELPYMWLISRVHEIIEHRRKTSISRVDLLQLMLQAATTDTIIVSKIVSMLKLFL